MPSYDGESSGVVAASFKVILFDLGGVLIELGKSPLPPECLSAGHEFTQLDWFQSETAILFEKGMISAHEFIEKFKMDLNLDVDSDIVLEHFVAWPIGFFSGVESLLLMLQKNYRLAVLSNTNELHWPRITRAFNFSHYFDSLFASHLLKMAKPEVGIFQHVITELNVRPEEILFLDDNLINVEASRSMGICGIQVHGIQNVLDVLIEMNVVRV